MGIYSLCQRHRTGMSNDLFDHCLIHMCFGQHRNAGMSGAVWRLSIAKLFHQRHKITIVVIPIVKMLLIRCM